VDGRNPAPVDRGFIPLFTGFQPSKVVQDFFHPQYDQEETLECCAFITVYQFILNIITGMMSLASIQFFLSMACDCSC